MKPSAPMFTAALSLDLSTSGDGGKYVTSAWSVDDYDDTELATGYIKDIKFAMRMCLLLSLPIFD